MDSLMQSSEPCSYHALNLNLATLDPGGCCLGAAGHSFPCSLGRRAQHHPSTWGEVCASGGVYSSGTWDLWFRRGLWFRWVQAQHHPGMWGEVHGSGYRSSSYTNPHTYTQLAIV